MGLRVVLHALVEPMFKAQQPWALMGSSASVLQGIPDYTPPDIDLMTTMEGAYIMEGADRALRRDGAAGRLQRARAVRQLLRHLRGRRA